MRQGGQLVLYRAARLLERRPELADERFPGVLAQQLLVSCV